MARTVLFLGAGASADAGAPLVGSFVSAVEQAHGCGAVDPADYALFLKIRTAAYASDDIEALLNVAPSVDDDAFGALSAIMAHTLEASVEYSFHGGMPRPSDGSYLALSSLLRAKGAEPGGLALLTVNYDVCADVAIYDSGWRPYYCLNPERGPDPGEITLAKLHGSLPWHGCIRPSCGYISADPHVDEFSRSCLSAQPDAPAFRLEFRRRLSAAPHRCPTCGRDTQRPLIVPPVTDKSVYRGKMKILWDRASVEIKEAERLLIGGYSFRDIDKAVNDLLLSCAQGPLQRLVIGDRDPGTRRRIADRFKSLKPAIHIVEHDTFRSALPSI